MSEHSEETATLLPAHDGFERSSSRAVSLPGAAPAWDLEDALGNGEEDEDGLEGVPEEGEEEEGDDKFDLEPVSHRNLAAISRWQRAAKVSRARRAANAVRTSGWGSPGAAPGVDPRRTHYAELSAKWRLPCEVGRRGVARCVQFPRSRRAGSAGRLAHRRGGGGIALHTPDGITPAEGRVV